LLTEARLWWEVVAGEITPPDLTSEAGFIKAALELLPAEPWDAETWRAWANRLSDATGTKGRALYQPLRLALTGEDHGPEMAALLPLIGYKRVSERLARIVV
jgi:glutamyl-tRNA synthetase